MNKRLYRIIIAGAMLAAAFFLPPEPKIIRLAVFIAAYLTAGYDVVTEAVKNIFKGRVFDENFLMSLATIGAFFVKGYAEAVAVMLFYQIGELFQSRAEDKSRRSIRALLDIRPDHTNVKRGNDLVNVVSEEVIVGDIIVIKPGERIPLDARVIEGNSMIDTSALTGESLPQTVSEGSVILAGCINLNGVVTAEVTKGYGESTASKILDLVEKSGNKKSRKESFIRRFAYYYTPVVVVIAVLLAIVPLLLVPGAVFNDWIYRALIFLVVSCPCALVVSVPLSFFSGIGGASRKGILVKGGNYLEALALTETVAFDKTGTLTKGVFSVREIQPVNMSKEELLEFAAHAESLSQHPISLSIVNAYGKGIAAERVKDVEEIAGRGLSANVDGRKVIAGNEGFMKENGIEIAGQRQMPDGTAVHIAFDGSYAGFISIADEIKEDSQRALQLLKAEGVRHTVMLTGDNRAVAEDIGKALGIEKVYSELLPPDKVAVLEDMISGKQAGRTLAFVGDGINDAPVLARADVGIAMGGLGSDAAIEAADVVIMTDEPSKVPIAIRIAKMTLRIVKQNIAFAISIKVLVLLLGAMGMATMWEAVFADVGVTVLVVANSFRTLRS